MPSILFGPDPLPLRRETGEFHCPSCMERRRYQRTEVRRGLSLGRLRIPLGRVAEYVECATCMCTFRPEVLAYDAGDSTPVVMAEYQRALKRILALMIMVDGAILEPEVEMVRVIFRDVSGVDLDPEDVAEEMEDVRRNPTSVSRYLARVAGYLNAYGKEQVLRGAALVSRSDGVLHPREAAMVRRLAGVLRVPERRVEDLLEEA